MKVTRRKLIFLKLIIHRGIMKSDKRIFENEFTNESIEFELIILNSRRNYQDSIIIVARSKIYSFSRFENLEQ